MPKGPEDQGNNTHVVTFSHITIKMSVMIFLARDTMSVVDVLKVENQFSHES